MHARARWNWVSTCGCWHVGFTANHAKAKFSFAKRTGLTDGFCGHVRGCWRRRKKKKRPRPQRRNKKRRARKQNEFVGNKRCNKRRNGAIRGQISGGGRRRPFPRGAGPGALLPGYRHVSGSAE